MQSAEEGTFCTTWTEPIKVIRCNALRRKGSQFHGCACITLYLQHSLDMSFTLSTSQKQELSAMEDDTIHLQQELRVREKRIHRMQDKVFSFNMYKLVSSCLAVYPYIGWVQIHSLEREIARKDSTLSNLLISKKEFLIICGRKNESRCRYHFWVFRCFLLPSSWCCLDACFWLSTSVNHYSFHPPTFTAYF